MRLAFSLLGDWEEARDAAQEAFVKAYRKRSGFRAEAAWGTWFYRILVNHCRDQLRRRAARRWLTFVAPGPGPSGDPLSEHPDPREGPEDEAERWAFRRSLQAALRHLPRRQREVFQLKALSGLTLAEAAGALGISEGAAKSHFFRATRALQQALAPWKEGP
ncbi:MAG: RNA polymerase sigma factor RpoE [Deferrisomatales bacterium]